VTNTDVKVGAKIVWQAWRDNMIRQGRYVPEERMSWETLPEQDKELDESIYEDVINAYIALIWIHL
jgi:hypothetical protein